MVVFDFSGVYRRQNFYEKKNFRREDLRKLQGTNCYLDEEAEKEVDQRLGEEKVWFLDSGNYHYMSYLRLRRIREPFELLMLDHHSDLQPAAFGGILSCGGWLRMLMEENPYLKRVWLAGPAEEDLRKHGEEFRDRIVFLSEERMREPGACRRFLEELRPEAPLYLSIDKDVLREEDVNCNWDQGNLSFEELEEGLCKLKENLHSAIRGVDICGEPEEGASEQELKQSDEINERLLSVL